MASAFPLADCRNERSRRPLVTATDGPADGQTSAMEGGSSRSQVARTIEGGRDGPLTGLLGGSFNPAHGGHRAITRAAIAALGLTEAWWLVSPGNPLKPAEGMAPLETRFRSAEVQAAGLPVKVTAIERELGTRYTIDTLRALKRRFRRRRFVWLMGTDNLAQFHMWKDWQAIAREMPIAAIARPGYDDSAVASPAMAWLRPYRLTASGLANRAEWSAPALIELRFDPDPRSATEIRRADPDWASRLSGPPPRDGLTHSRITAPADRPDA